MTRTRGIFADLIRLAVKRSSRRVATVESVALVMAIVALIIASSRAA